MLLPQLVPDTKTVWYRVIGSLLFLSFVGGLIGYIWGADPLSTGNGKEMCKNKELYSVAIGL